MGLKSFLVALATLLAIAAVPFFVPMSDVAIGILSAATGLIGVGLGFWGMGLWQDRRRRSERLGRMGRSRQSVNPQA